MQMRKPQEVRGSFDAVGGMSKSDPGYWRALDEHLNKTTTLKHVSAQGVLRGRMACGERLAAP